MKTSVLSWTNTRARRVIMRKAALVVLGLFLLGIAAPVASQEATPEASPAPMGTVDITPVDGVISFTVIEVPASDAVVDQAPEGDSAGDILVFANNVMDETGETQVGTDQGWCIRTNVAGGAWECTWTLFLAQGQIVSQGPFLDAGPSTMAITGGTGEFAGARGQLELSANEDGLFVFAYTVMLD
jgi:allene oxide cyclase